MTQPGAIGSAMPSDEATTLRRIADLERQMRELGPSIAASFNSTVAKVVSFDSIGASGAVLPTPTTPTVWASGSIVVPEGFSSVTILAISNSSIYNSTGGGTFMYVRTQINGSSGGSAIVSLGAGQAAQGMSTAIRTVGVTGGDTITCSTLVNTDATLPANGSSGANIDAILLFRKA